MPHICMDEINALLAGIPFVGISLLWLRSWVGGIFRRRCSKPCDHQHELPEVHNDHA